MMGDIEIPNSGPFIVPSVIFFYSEVKSVMLFK